jgi:general secretion pathway protein L
MAAAATIPAIGRLQAGITRAASWWLGQWRASLPDSLRSNPVTARPVRLSVHDGGHQVTMTFVDRNETEIFSESHSFSDYHRSSLDRYLGKARNHAGRGSVATSIVTTSAICGSLPIPVQARAQAEAIVRDLIVRRTPLTLEEVFVAHDLRPSADGKLDLHYLILPKARLDHLLSRLGLDLREVGTLEAPSPDGTAPVVLPLSPRREGSTLSGRIACGLVLIGVAALAATFGVQVRRQAAVLDGIEMRLALEAAPARQLTGRLRSVLGMAEDISRVAEIRSAPGVIRVWEELSRVIPDSTYLTEFEVQEDEVLASGYSDSAPELIRILEGSTLLHGASFTGSVVQDRMKGKEQFALRALLRQRRLPVEEGE